MRKIDYLLLTAKRIIVEAQTAFSAYNDDDDFIKSLGVNADDFQKIVEGCAVYDYAAALDSIAYRDWTTEDAPETVYEPEAEAHAAAEEQDKIERPFTMTGVLGCLHSFTKAEVRELLKYIPVKCGDYVRFITLEELQTLDAGGELPEADPDEQDERRKAAVDYWTAKGKQLVDDPAEKPVKTYKLLGWG